MDSGNRVCCAKFFRAHKQSGPVLSENCHSTLCYELRALNFVLGDTCQRARCKARRVISNVLGTVPKYRSEKLQLEIVFMGKAQKRSFLTQYKFQVKFRYIGTI